MILLWVGRAGLELVAEAADCAACIATTETRSDDSFEVMRAESSRAKVPARTELVPNAPPARHQQREKLRGLSASSRHEPKCHPTDSERQFVYIPPRLRGDDDLRYSGSPLVERRAFPVRRLSKSLLGPLPGLGLLLQDERSLRLAVLNSCEGARSSHVDPFSGAAASLVHYGVPAVIGMQFEMLSRFPLAVS